MSSFFFKNSLIFDVTAVDLGNTFDQFIGQEYKWDRLKLASAFHPSLVEKI